MGYRSAQSSRHFVRMPSYRQNENDGGHLELCAVCEAVVAGWAEGNSVCATCGMTVVEWIWERPGVKFLRATRRMCAIPTRP